MAVPIAIPHGAQIIIAADGSITALNAGDAPNATVQLGRLKLVPHHRLGADAR